ncbi:hypothetical protein FA15DRAFT_662782 [Coprinopsis marcescibilis]|uniref:Actin cortical patch SUR7/pH-response regulator PalI n=1 Tax=Coprinopsis marcescibilis TaxID=230819 RepID=A0A5C3LCF0_COPMA|nr:hypothetical protein FA15DRAFT_662782 [Coprinopsis marcescibilis]
MRGEFCIGLGSVLSLASLILLIFVHVGQINTTSVPRNIYMVNLDTSGYQESLFLALGQNNFSNVYARDSAAPLGEHLGLRHNYYYGLYSYCGYLTRDETSEGQCTQHVMGYRYQPLSTMLADLPRNLSSLSESFIPQITPFTDTDYSGQSTKAAYWMVLLGTVCAALAFATGIPKNNFTFCLSTLFAVAGSFLLLVGASIWTVVINRTDDVNQLLTAAANKSVPLGITVSMGHGVIILWVAFATLAASIVPYMISCCTWRG